MSGTSINAANELLQEWIRLPLSPDELSKFRDRLCALYDEAYRSGYNICKRDVGDLLQRCTNGVVCLREDQSGDR